jgi:hypothetical protein
VRLGLNASPQDAGSRTGLHFVVDDLPFACKTTVSAGGEVVTHPREVQPGVVLADMADTEGNIFTLSLATENERQHRSARGAQRLVLSCMAMRIGRSVSVPEGQLMARCIPSGSLLVADENRRYGAPDRVAQAPARSTAQQARPHGCKTAAGA